MEKNENQKEVRVGDFLVENGIISRDQLDDALDMQKHNPQRLVGEILVTQGALTKEEMVMALEMYLMVTNTELNHVDEWLDQDEIDMIKDKLTDE